MWDVHSTEDAEERGGRSASGDCKTQDHTGGLKNEHLLSPPFAGRKSRPRRCGGGRFLPGRFMLLVAAGSPGSPGLGAHLSSLCLGAWPPPAPLSSGCTLAFQAHPHPDDLVLRASLYLQGHLPQSRPPSRALGRPTGVLGRSNKVLTATV